MSDAFQFLLLALVVWRICRIVVAEDGPFDVFAKLRDRFGVMTQKTWMQRGFACMACVSFWLGIIAAVLRFGWSVESVIYGLALSAVSVILMRRVG